MRRRAIPADERCDSSTWSWSIPRLSAGDASHRPGRRRWRAVGRPHAAHRQRALYTSAEDSPPEGGHYAMKTALAWTVAGLGVLAIAGTVVSLAQRGPASSSMTNKGLTAVAGIRVGHHTLSERPTGCTVVVVDGDGAIGGYSQRGGAPGTRDADLLNPLNTVEQVNAIFLTGGSAYGLSVGDGVSRYLEEKKVGYKIAGTVVPIVPGAVLMDLGFGGELEDPSERRLRLSRGVNRDRRSGR